MLQTIIDNVMGKHEAIAFKLADQDFCIDIGLVREIRGWSPTTVLPHAPDYVRGVINLRGAVVTVIDLSARLGFGLSEPTHRHVVIIAMYEGRIVGLLADLVSDIVTISDDSIQAVPDIASDPAHEFISGMITFEDGRILRKIDLKQLLPDVPQTGG
ncbi:chemotaxis protein CheW [Roseinatronobacter bogoriensis]|uniref:Chemotaxis protein CheW n=1 Tax=Roseinatronobacter bogoriensis subsp. barguzinensis TaxID=441209 RepID=A0A2K8K865_9RHOB|nr:MULTISPECIES: chemotaxis protein CheW [Rhodobaca]ATX65641.1 chemotaxis protein CheW [Rhodobaca barguzinensis]MBB4208422.1 purine-binding chemotaxis protein CheW [Rhodobaca bogoriensis DSM 18756]TDW39064.1 purine-binding chemotaxis protein CheW [Rhodobaca barguzinensis]TDY68754.1 purine-binding chemotaxis protein CheW [Rhodobaca bogoriensis DSM 18756]